MPRFQYTFQPALDVTLAHERNAHAVTVRAEAALENERRALAALDSDLRNVRVAAHARAAARRRVALWLDVAAHSAALARMRTVRLLNLDVAQRQLASACVAHESIRRRKAALTRHRERRYEAFVAECERRDANELDETNGLRCKAGASQAGKYGV